MPSARVREADIQYVEGKIMQHHFDVDIAKKYGILEAVLIDHIYFWVAKNRANGANYIDGKYWTFNSKKAFSELFPYASERQIKYALDKLRLDGVIEVAAYNKSNYDRTLFYTLTDRGYSMLQNCPLDWTNLSNRTDNIVQPIPYTNTDINTDGYMSSPNGSDILGTQKRKRKPFVPPTLEEVQAYCKERNSPVNPKTFWEYYNAGEWKDSKGNPVKNWKQKLITWERGGMNGSAKSESSVHFELDNRGKGNNEDYFDDLFGEG